MRLTTKTKLRIGVIGSSGMLGKDLVRVLGNYYVVSGINRENYAKHLGNNFDVLINANGNSRRYWANQNILADFEASTVSVYKSIFDFHCRKYIYISSSDVYENHTKQGNTLEKQVINSNHLCPYGFHKYLSEQIVRTNTTNYLILRCSMMLGLNLKKGPLYDILQNREIFVTPDSYFQMITTEEVAYIIDRLIRKAVTNEVFNVGGKKSVSLKKINSCLGKSPKVLVTAKKQEYEMDVSKINKIYSLKESEDYLQIFIKTYNYKRS